MINIICAVIAMMSAVACAFIGAYANRAQKKSERRAELRQKENLLSLRMMDATMQLASIIAIKLLEGDAHLNGNVEAAKNAAIKAAEEYQEFMRGVTAYEVGK